MVNDQKIKSEGSDGQHHGSCHWLLERGTSVALIPLTFWAVYSVVTLNGASHDQFVQWLQMPLNAGLLIVTVLVSFYHAVLGLQVVIDDYIASRTSNRIQIIAAKIGFTVMAVLSIVSIVKIAF